MAPLDDLNGDSVLAEFEQMIRGSGIGCAGPDLSTGALVPERRAVNWVNALAALAREIEDRQGPRRADMLLRTVGSRMSRDLLTPLPAVRDEFEPAINRALSILDWGWVAVLDRRDTIVFEHRAPWPFDKRPDHLPFVLEGFYTEILQRLADDEAMQVRMTGKRGGALVFKWLHADRAAERQASHAPPVIVPEAPAIEPVASLEAPPAADDEPLLDAPTNEMQRLRVAPERSLVTDRRLPPLTDPRAVARQSPSPRPAIAPMRATPAPATTKSSTGPVPVLLVAASVFAALFVLGLMTSTGDMVGGLLHRLGRVSSTATETRGMVSALESRARGGDTDAQIRLGLKLADAGGDRPDYVAAARWFGAAAKAGSLEAKYDFGVMTAEGLGVKRDSVAAAILYMSAATGGFPLAEYRLGAAYQNGLGVSRDAASAAMWYERAARHGVTQAQFALAGLYAAGQGVAADPIVAYSWYRLAETDGARDATEKRVALYRQMSARQRAEAQAQANALIGDLGGARSMARPPAHPPIDRLIAQMS